MDNKQVRARNIDWLIDSYGGTAAFAKAVEREQVQVSQWRGGKAIGDRLARSIESALKKPHGWLDQPQWSESEPQSALVHSSHRERLDASSVATTARALQIVLRRRNNTVFDPAQPEHAALFVEAYAELVAMPPDDPEAQTAFGAVVADLVLAREGRKDGRIEGEQAGGTDRGQHRKKGAA
ncbi:hypothetical protein ASD78_12170 [Lysobacter sp. Root667]|uniref:hypothetical protein n=1 Tax=Lysobacter sp. Root667 TaxID=1736581 RepID=UPI000701889F|nr:hypothetical protein [Lysobacter sp. Root667]KRA74243.1 hypothetical protein ASD78_12170 [Lysobacter sp. Root667]